MKKNIYMMFLLLILGLSVLSINAKNINVLKNRTIVIDVGHGGIC